MVTWILNYLVLERSRLRRKQRAIYHQKIGKGTWIGCLRDQRESRVSRDDSSWGTSLPFMSLSVAESLMKKLFLLWSVTKKGCWKHVDNGENNVKKERRKQRNYSHWRERWNFVKSLERSEFNCSERSEQRDLSEFRSWRTTLAERSNSITWKYVK